MIAHVPEERRAHPPMDPLAARQAYKDLAAEAGRLLHLAEDAHDRLARAEEERLATYAKVEEEFAHLEGLEQRAEGIWRELTTRFGPQATGELPEPAELPAVSSAEPPPAMSSPLSQALSIDPPSSRAASATRPRRRRLRGDMLDSH